MLKHWQTHAEYQLFISETVASLNPSQLKKLHSMSDSWHKLTSMNFDPVGDFLAPFYSDTGRPAINQPQILRSFILMLDHKFTSLTKWTIVLKGDDLLAMLIGCSPDCLPPLGSYFDFINRLWLRNPNFEKSGRNDLFPANKNRKPSSKPEKNKKLPNRHSGITKVVADYALTERDFPFYYEKNCNSSSPSPLLFHLWNWVLLTRTILLHRVMAPVSIPMPIHVGTRFANVPKMAFITAHVHVITLTRTPHGAGTVT